MKKRDDVPLFSVPSPAPPLQKDFRLFTNTITDETAELSAVFLFIGGVSPVKIKKFAEPHIW